MANRPSQSSTSLFVPSWLEGISVLRVNKLDDMQGAGSGAFEGWSPVISVGGVGAPKSFCRKVSKQAYRELCNPTAGKLLKLHSRALKAKYVSGIWLKIEFSPPILFPPHVCFAFSGGSRSCVVSSAGPGDIPGDGSGVVPLQI